MYLTTVRGSIIDQSAFRRENYSNELNKTINNPKGENPRERICS